MPSILKLGDSIEVLGLFRFYKTDIPVVDRQKSTELSIDETMFLPSKKTGVVIAIPKNTHHIGVDITFNKGDQYYGLVHKSSVLPTVDIFQQLIKQFNPSIGKPKVWKASSDIKLISKHQIARSMHMRIKYLIVKEQLQVAQRVLWAAK